jgi:hypothetical protein
LVDDDGRYALLVSCSALECGVALEDQQGNDDFADFADFADRSSRRQAVRVAGEGWR